MANTTTPFHFPNCFPPICDAVTWHAIGAYHDPITCKVKAETYSRLVTYWPLWALTRLVRAGHGKTLFSFFRTASDPFGTPILRMWSDHGMIPSHAKYRPEISSFGRRFVHLVRLQLPGRSAQNDQTSLSFFPNFFSPVRDTDTFHVVRSYYDQRKMRYFG
jgi:hypothetical protein